MYPDWMVSPHSTGTSIMAAEYDNGVVIGADSRSTAGAYIANRFADKLTKITDLIYCCRSGSSADTQAIADVISYNLNFYAMEIGEAPLVENAAAVCRELCYNYRDSLMAGLIIAGWDHKKRGQVFAIPIGGMCIPQPVAVGGSGSTYIYGYVDANFRRNMTKQKCVDFVVKSLGLAMGRDGSSGGIIRLGIITKNGIERMVFAGNSVPSFYNE